MITRNPGSRSLLIRPVGDLDALRAEELRQRIRPLLSEGFRFVIFDLEETRYVTSSGLGLLVEIHGWVSRDKGLLKLVNCSERIETLLKQTKLDRMLKAPDDPYPLNLPFDSLHALLSREALFASRLHELTELLLNCASAEQTAVRVLEGMADACGAKQGAIFLYAPDRQELTLAGAVGLEPSVYAAASTVSLAGDGLERMLLLAGEDSSVWCTHIGEPVEAPSRLQQILGFGRGVLCCLKNEGKLQAFVLMREPDVRNTGADYWIPQLRFYCEISARFLSRIHRVVQLETENIELRSQLLEAHKAHEMLTDASKLAALGAVISGVGHMLNNKLVPIIGYTQLLSQLQEIPEKAQQQIQTVGLAAAELKATMDQLIKASRAREISPEPTELNPLLARVVTLMGYQFESRNVKLRLQFEPSLPLISGDPDLLLQAFLVLLRRACDSFDDDATERWVEVRTCLQGDQVEVIVEDNGRGLGSASSDDWIDPLATYVASDAESGQNFSIPRSVVRRHNGELTLKARKDGGTVVHLLFPTFESVAGLAPLSVSSHA
jgi:anti-anti-sigma factor